MGPRSDNRGYAIAPITHMSGSAGLQWVHGRITVVMGSKNVPNARCARLQWVHGRITVVMLDIPQSIP